MPSASFAFADLIELVEQADNTSSDGVVVVQGTDTIEETAFLADLLWTRDEPLVVTSAMRTPAMAGAGRTGEPARRVDRSATRRCSRTRRARRHE